MIYMLARINSFFFYRLVNNCGVRIFVTQRGSAGLATCLAHWISLDENVLHTLRCTSTYTLLYIALFVTGRPRNSYLSPRKKIKEKHCRRGSSRSRSIFLSLSKRERRDDRRRSRDRICSAETRRVLSQKAKPSPIKS